MLLLEEDADLAEVMLACTETRLGEVQIRASANFACNVLLLTVILDLIHKVT